jgi:flagellar biosynthesis GTPase FlhF
LEYFARKSIESSPSLQGENSVDSLLNQLYTQIKRQELFSADIQTCLQNLRLAMHSGNNASSINNLQEILKKIRPLDIFEAQRLVLKAKDAAGLIAGKDIVLLIGETGSGKSTTIYFLAGSRMEATEVEIEPGKPLQHIAPVGPIKNPGLHNITTSPYHKSETRSR